MIKPSQPPLARWENMPTGLRPMEMHPLWYLRYHLPTRERWDYKAPISSYLISIARERAAKTSPSGESTAAGGDRGAFPSRQRRGCMVFHAHRAVGLFSYGR